MLQSKREVVCLVALLVAHVTAVAIVACRVPADPVEPPIDPIPVPGADCKQACAALIEHDCEEGRPTEDGAPCTEVCANGMAEFYDLACVAGLQDCRVELCELAGVGGEQLTDGGREQ